MRKTKASTLRIPDSYFELVRRFPLVPIRNDSHLKEAESVLHDLLTERLDSGGRAYLEVLTDLVEAYEDVHHGIDEATASSVLRLLMESNRLTQTELSKSVGMSTASISAVLNETKSLTKQQVIVLAGYFRVSPTVFLSAA